PRIATTFWIGSRCCSRHGRGARPRITARSCNGREPPSARSGSPTAERRRCPANNPLPCTRLTDGTDAPVNNNINEWGIRNEYRKDRRNRRRFGRNRRRVRRDSTDGHDSSRRRSHRWNLRDRGSPRARHGDGTGAYRPGPHLRRGSCGRHVHRGDTGKHRRARGRGLRDDHPEEYLHAAEALNASRMQMKGAPHLTMRGLRLQAYKVPMNDWLEAISASDALSTDAAEELEHRGFTVIRDVLPPSRLERLRHAYDAAMSSASGAELRIGSTTTRLGDFINRGEEIDALYTFPPLLDACRRII